MIIALTHVGYGAIKEMIAKIPDVICRQLAATRTRCCPTPTNRPEGLIPR